MKIILSHSQNDLFQGLGATFFAMGEQATFWEKGSKPTLDMLEEIQPDIVILHDYEVDETAVIGAQDYSQTKFVVVGHNFRDDFKPALVCVDKETENANPIMVCRPAANLAKYCSGKKLEEHASDLFFLSDFDTSGSIIPNILTTLDKHRIRVVGDFPIPIPQYVGRDNLATINNLIASTKIAIDFTGKHHLDYAINKVFCLSSEENDVVTSFGLEDYESQVFKYLDVEKLRSKEVKKAYKKVLDTSATYFHRAEELFIKLGNKEAAAKAIAKMEYILDVNDKIKHSS